FSEALGKVQLKPTARIIQRMIDIGLEVNDAGIQWSADDLAQQVREELEEEHRAIYGDADAESLARVLGEEGLKRIREREVARVRGKQASVKPGPTQERQKEPERRRLTTEVLE